MNCSIQVEGVLGVVKNDYEFQRFFPWINKAKLEILILSMGYYFNKLHTIIQKDRKISVSSAGISIKKL